MELNKFKIIRQTHTVDFWHDGIPYNYVSDLTGIYIYKNIGESRVKIYDKVNDVIVSDEGKEILRLLKEETSLVTFSRRNKKRS